MTESLRACPFCGGAAKVRSAQCAEDAVETWVECKGCGAISERTEDAYADHPTAIHLWNRRATVALPDREEVARTIWDALGSWREWDETHEDSMTEALPIDVRSAADAILDLLRKGVG